MCFLIDAFESFFSVSSPLLLVFCFSSSFRFKMFLFSRYRNEIGRDINERSLQRVGREKSTTAFVLTLLKRERQPYINIYVNTTPTCCLVPCGVDFFYSDSNSDSEKNFFLASDSVHIFCRTATPRNSEFFLS